MKLRTSVFLRPLRRCYRGCVHLCVPVERQPGQAIYPVLRSCVAASVRRRVIRFTRFGFSSLHSASSRESWRESSKRSEYTKSKKETRTLGHAPLAAVDRRIAPRRNRRSSRHLVRHILDIRACDRARNLCSQCTSGYAYFFFFNLFTRKPDFHVFLFFVAFIFLW